VSHGADVNSKNMEFYTPLHYSSDKGHFVVVEYLVKHGADINSMTNDNSI